MQAKSLSGGVAVGVGGLYVHIGRLPIGGQLEGQRTVFVFGYDNVAIGGCKRGTSSQRAQVRGGGITCLPGNGVALGGGTRKHMQTHRIRAVVRAIVDANSVGVSFNASYGGK